MKKFSFRFVCDKCGYSEYVENPMNVKKDCPKGCGGTSYASSTPVISNEKGRRR